MRAAIGEAESSGIVVVLMDRNVQVTLARAWRRLSFWEKMKMIYASLVAVFEAEDIDEQDIERLKEKDMLTTAVEEMARHAPTIKEVLIDERDAYMAKKIADIPSDKVVAVVGAGHMKGILRQMENPVDDLSVLEEVPPGASGFWAWVLPLLIMGLLVSGFFFGGPQHGYDMLKWWAVSTMACTALATIVVFAHPVTILVATLSAPLTTLHPALASGWFAGLSEAYMKKPRVVDFEHIHDDIMTLGGWWRNPVTRILLVFFMSNLGSSIGVFIAAPVLARMALGG
jgi:pheromone shutdown-related protein TraB